MPRTSWIQNNFNGGEWSPLTFGRSDIAKYKNGLETCLNYVPTAQGGLTRRPGTKYVANTKTNQAVRLVSFEFSITQAYVLEFGNGYVRFYTNEGQLLSGGSPYEVVTPYTTADLWDLAFTQSADVLYISHPNYKPRKLQRAGALSWSLATISFLDGPYLILNSTATTLTASATTGSGVTLTASSTTGINGGAGFSSNDIGRLVRLKVGSTWGYCTITGFTSTTVVTVTVNSTLGGATATSLWRMGVWYGVEGSSSTANYPRCVVFNQDRLVWAGSAAYPNRIDGSNTSDYENYAPSNTDGTVIDSNAISFSLNSTKVNVVNWMVSDEWGLLAGTASGEWVIAASTQQNAVTPTNVTAKMTSAYGGANVPPIKMGKSTLFVQRTKRKLREMSYQFALGTFQAPDISLISEHLTKGGIKSMAAQPAPYPNVWLARYDGTLVGVSYDKDQEVLGWHRHQLGGFSDAAQTLPPVVESVAVIPSPSTDRDAVWLSVQRYVNGATVRTVEPAKFRSAWATTARAKLCALKVVRATGQRREKSNAFIVQSLDSSNLSDLVYNQLTALLSPNRSAQVQTAWTIRSRSTQVINVGRGMAVTNLKGKYRGHRINPCRPTYWPLWLNSIRRMDDDCNTIPRRTLCCPRRSTVAGVRPRLHQRRSCKRVRDAKLFHLYGGG